MKNVIFGMCVIIQTLVRIQSALLWSHFSIPKANRLTEWSRCGRHSALEKRCKWSGTSMTVAMVTSQLLFLSCPSDTEGPRSASPAEEHVKTIKCGNCWTAGMKAATFMLANVYSRWRHWNRCIFYSNSLKVKLNLETLTLKPSNISSALGQF